MSHAVRAQDPIHSRRIKGCWCHAAGWRLSPLAAMNHHCSPDAMRADCCSGLHLLRCGCSSDRDDLCFSWSSADQRTGWRYSLHLESLFLQHFNSFSASGAESRPGDPLTRPSGISRSLNPLVSLFYSAGAVPGPGDRLSAAKRHLKIIESTGFFILTLQVQYQGLALDFAQPFRRATMRDLVRWENSCDHRWLMVLGLFEGQRFQ